MGTPSAVCSLWPEKWLSKALVKPAVCQNSLQKLLQISFQSPFAANSRQIITLPLGSGVKTRLQG
jgi:hypothetical protein